VRNIDLIQIQKYYEKQVTLREVTYERGKAKKRKLRRWIWLMYFQYKNEYRIIKPVEISIRRGLR
jgi:type IV secretory pathway component VirB8